MSDWKTVDRLNNDEFSELLPHLSLKELFLTQVHMTNRVWRRLLDVDFKKLKALCVICHKHLEFQNVRRHYQSKQHDEQVKLNVTQFYHPYFTYGKTDWKLAMQESVSFDEKQDALEELYANIKPFSRDLFTADRFNTMVNGKEKEHIDNYLIRLLADEKIESPDYMAVKAELPGADISELVYTMTENDDEWQPVIESKYSNNKGPFTCTICNSSMRNVKRVNVHLISLHHKKEQLNVYALRFKKSTKVSKNSCIQFGDEFKLSISEEEAKNFQERVEKWLSIDANGEELEPLEIPELSPEITEKLKILEDLRTETVDKHNDGKMGRRVSDGGDGGGGNNDNNSDNNDNNDNTDGSKIDRSNNSSNEPCYGFIGVEYVLKIVNVSDAKTSYECCLCKFTGNASNMQKHLLNYDHKRKYLDFHYHSTVRKYEKSIGHMKFIAYRSIMVEIVKSIAIGIEECHGRSLPYTISRKEYEICRVDVLKNVYAMRHASEKRGPSFSRIVPIDEIKRLKKEAKSSVKNYLSERVKLKNIVFTESCDRKHYLKQISNDPAVVYKHRWNNTSRREGKRRSRSPADNDDRRLPDSSSYSSRIREQQPHRRGRERSTTRSRSPLSPPTTLYNRDRRSNSYHRKDDDTSPTLSDKLYEKISHAIRDIEHNYSNYRKNPENHPQYEEEWNEFWQRRKLELEREGVNYRTYNFQPEWVRYFKKRIEQLYDCEITNTREKLYRKYNMNVNVNVDDDDVNDIQLDNRHNHGNNMDLLDHHRNFNDMKDLSLMSANPTDLYASRRDSMDNSNMLLKNTKIRSSYHHHRQHHANDEDDDQHQQQQQQQQQLLLYSSSKRHDSDPMKFEDNKKSMMMSSTNTSSTDPNKMSNLTDNHSNLVHVLRLITALEDHLGSLGNKVMDLLGTALKLEKNFRGNIMDFESQILTPANCNMLETAVEKLKGILFAGLVDSKKMSGFNRVIQVTTELLNYADERGWRHDTTTTTTTTNIGKQQQQQQQQSKSNVQLMQMNPNTTGSGSGGSGGEHYHHHQHLQTEDVLKDFTGYNPNQNHRINETTSNNCPPPPQIKMMNAAMHSSNQFTHGKDLLMHPDTTTTTMTTTTNNHPNYNVVKSLLPMLRFPGDNSSGVNMMEGDDYNNSNKGGGGGIPRAAATTLLRNTSNTANLSGGNMDMGNQYVENTQHRYNSNNSMEMMDVTLMGAADDGVVGGGGGIGVGGSAVMLSQNQQQQQQQQHYGGIQHSNDNIGVNLIGSGSGIGNDVNNLKQRLSRKVNNMVATSSNLIVPIQHNKNKSLHHHHLGGVSGSAGAGGGGNIGFVGGLADQKLTTEKQNSSSKISWSSMPRSKRN